jgi:type VI secretion system secreted protein VgrG
MATEETTTQKHRLLRIHTQLKEDFLMINRLTAEEGISKLFSYDVELVHAEEKEGFKPTIADVQRLLGQHVSIFVNQKDGTNREFNGIVNYFTQGTRHARFTFYRIRVVPQVWLLTQVQQSRIFQHKSVPEILKEVFKDFDVSYEIRGDFKARNYCVQYRETDFDFASRLMEEEGIFYFFEHSKGRHKMILANQPASHPFCITKKDIPYFINVGDEEDFITSINVWNTNYQLQTGTITYWDHNFQLKTNKLQGQQTSRYNVGFNQTLEVYDHPGGYAKKYDDVDSGGKKRSDLPNVFPDKDQTAQMAMEMLDAQHKTTSGKGDCSSMTAGYRFNLINHPTSDWNGQYIVTSIRHEAFQTPTYVSVGEGEFTVEEKEIDAPYTNSFQCLAWGGNAPPFRPIPVTPKPVVEGSQTAIVVGPAGDEIFTDEYGRVKVQFHWDRYGQGDSNSSCWIRVAQSWASNRWGTMFIPRVGMEVIVHFLEGDPDQPIITGCVYNPATMPPYELPAHKTKMTIKSNSSKGGKGFNELRFEDEKGKEHIFMHAEKDQHIRVKANRREFVIGDGEKSGDRHLTVGRDKREKVVRDKHIIVKRHQKEEIKKDYHLKVGGAMNTRIGGTLSHQVGGNIAEKVGKDHTEEVGQTLYLKAGMKVVIEAGMQLTLKGPGGFIDIGPGGIAINGLMVKINSPGSTAGMANMLSPCMPEKPDEAELPINADPGSDAPTYKNQRANIPKRKLPSYTNPWHKPDSPKNKDKKHWIEIQLFDEDGNPVPYEKYRITLPDGQTLAEGTLNEEGWARVDHIDPGTCKVTFPELDEEVWNKM